jgi:hypothetical protein
MSSTRIMFLRDANYVPTGCLAINVDRKNHRLSYQFSVLNPADKFNRSVARQLALGRLLEKPIFVPLKRDEEINMHTISQSVMLHLSNSKSPGRAIKAAKFWLMLQSGHDSVF